MPQIRKLVAGFLTWRHGFDLRKGYVRFVVDKMTMGKIFSEYPCFPCQFSFHLILHTHHHLQLSYGASSIGLP